MNNESDQFFNRAWAIQSTEHEVPSTRCSSPASPGAIRPRKRPRHRNAYSEASVSRGDVRSESWGPAPPGVLRSSDSGLPDLNASRTSSISERARKLLKISTSPKGAMATTDADIIETVRRPSLQWKRQISDRWIEIRVGRKSKADGHSRRYSTDSILTEPDAAIGLEAIPVYKGFKVLPSQPDYAAAQAPEHLKPVPLSKKVGLYSRTRRRFGLQPNSEKPAPQIHRTNTFTQDVLERVSSMLRDVSTTTKTSPPLSRRTSNQSMTGSHTRPTRRFPFSLRSPYASSSSLQKMGVRIPPSNSPEDQEMYKDSDGRKHLVVEMTSRDGPAYLPSEARRIGTPPLPSSTPGVLRGFFLEDDPLPKGIPSFSITESQPDGKEITTHTDADWFQANLAEAKARENRFRFELNVPEHLPSSPLCPKHPKNRHTRGKGICVYHGRNMTVGTSGEFEAGG